MNLFGADLRDDVLSMQESETWMPVAVEANSKNYKVK